MSIITAYSDKIWKKSWDPHVKDLDPKEWEKTYLDSIKSTFESFPDKVALAFIGLEITYKELDLYSNQFANMLIETGFKKGDIVGINLPNIPEYVVALIGALKVGCIVSGVSPLSSSIQIQDQLNDLGSKGNKVALVTLDALFETKISEISTKIPQVELIIITNLASFLPKVKRILGKLTKKVPKGKVPFLKEKKVKFFLRHILEKYSANPVDIKVDVDDVAFIQYSGGTTGGMMKGAMITHRNAVADMIITQKWLQWPHGTGIGLSGFPFFHIAGLFFCINMIYMAWTQVLIPNPRDTNNICKNIANYKPTFIANVPSLCQMLMNNPKFSKLDHSSLTQCFSSASPFPIESQQEFENIVGEGKLIEAYGMTETSPLTTSNPRFGKKKLGSIGLPFNNVDLKLINTETGEEVPLGKAGEICVRGPMVMKGYFNKPEETKIAIDADGFMHTGDVAIMDEEGYLRIIDRVKDMIIVSGFKVFSTKLEKTLAEHPAVRLVATIGVENPERPGSEIVKAFIQLDPRYKFDGNEKALKNDIINFAQDQCSPYEVPKIIEFMKEIPLTSVGKIDKIVLRKDQE